VTVIRTAGWFDESGACHIARRTYRQSRTKVEPPALETGEMLVCFAQRERSVDVRDLSMIMQTEMRGGRSESKQEQRQVSYLTLDETKDDRR
jgi:hypothetical protein